MPSKYASIDGWFDFNEFYDEMVDRYLDGGKFVEVGCWFGKSSVYLLERIKEKNANITVDFVDTWLGCPNERDQIGVINQFGVDHVFLEFSKNIAEFSGYNIYRNTSLLASEKYIDQSLDFVYIDASHTKESIVTDINSWLPKIKIGGVLGGHDYYFPPINETVKEMFGDLHIVKDNSWYYIKSKI